MRVLRIASPVQLRLICVDTDQRSSEQVWAELPEATRQGVLVLLARLIARGAVDEEAVG